MIAPSFGLGHHILSTCRDGRVNEKRTPWPQSTQPDKTFIGRLERGFDFLGYHVTPSGLSVAPATWQRFCDRAHRVDEQERGKPDGFPRLGAYVRRWAGWAHGLQAACAGG